MEHEDEGESGDEVDNWNDDVDVAAIETLRTFFHARPTGVFYQRQLAVLHEKAYFHWITSRALRELINAGEIGHEDTKLANGADITLVWNRRYRYVQREKRAVTSLVEEFSAPAVGHAIGAHLEYLVLDGVSARQFVVRGRETNTHGGQKWSATNHNLDFIFERDGIAYGFEVKNKLAYMDEKEFRTKITMCQALGVRPVFVCRMLPKSWIRDLIEAGGFAWIMGYQMYPLAYAALVQRIRDHLQLPVDMPRRLHDGTVQRFIRWHEKLVEAM